MAVAAFMAALLLWLFSHPLLGIDNHDARVYAVLALHHLHPDAYARDPFFMFGSQDSYSLFSFFYAPLIDSFGLTVAGAALQLAGGLLWCGASLVLTHVLLRRDGLPDWLWIMAALAGAAMSVNYSPNGQTFVVNEGFPTARSLAFPLGLISLALVMKQRTVAALVCAAAASLLHPLLGIWPLAIAILAPLGWRWQLAALAAGSLTLGGLMYADLGPFSRFDPVWEAVLRAHTHDVFVAAADQMRWRGHLFQLGCLLLGALVAGPQTAVGRCYLLIGLISLLGLLFAALASYCWPSRIVVQAQLWRSMWLAAALMPFVLCHVLGVFIVRYRPWSMVLMGCVAFMLYEHDGLLYLLLALLLFVIVERRVSAEGGDRWLHAAGRLYVRAWLPLLSGGALLALLPLYWGELTLLAGAINRDFSPNLAEAIGLLIGGGLGVGFALQGWLLARYGAHYWCLGGLGILLLLSGLYWDQRSDRDRNWERVAAFGRQDELRALIHPGDVVLWEGRLPLNTWYELRTAHYASAAQAIGMVFSREKTFELLRRVAHIRAANKVEGGGAEDDGHPFRFHVPTGKGVIRLCADEELDWVVVPAEHTVSTDIPVTRVVEPGLAVYRCASIRTLVDRQSSGRV